MIGKIKVKLTSENQNIPLRIIHQFRGSESTLEIINVPNLTGIWKIKNIFIKLSYPDNSQFTLQAKKIQESYICTIPSCDVVGNGKYMVVADVITESGDVGDDFILGIGDLIILDVDMSPSPKQTKWRVNLISSLNDDPIKGDMYVDDLSSVIYDGSNWVSMHQSLSNYFTRSETQTEISSSISSAISPTVEVKDPDTLSILDTAYYDGNEENIQMYTFVLEQVNDTYYRAKTCFDFETQNMYPISEKDNLRDPVFMELISGDAVSYIGENGWFLREFYQGELDMESHFIDPKTITVNPTILENDSFQTEISAWYKRNGTYQKQYPNQVERLISFNETLLSGETITGEQFSFWILTK